MEIHPEEFKGVNRFFHFVQCKNSANSLSGIFQDVKLQQIALRAICILDGDQRTQLENSIVTLPTSQRKESPEVMVFQYAKWLFEHDSDFWLERGVVDRGFSKQYYLDNIAEKVDDFSQQLAQKRNTSQSTKGLSRSFYKKLFNDNKKFCEILFKHWLHNFWHQSCIDDFYRDLRILFKKVAPYNEINPNEWK